MAFALVSCEDSPATAIPQMNPQGPILEVTNVDAIPSVYFQDGDNISIPILEEAKLTQIAVISATVESEEIPSGASLGAILELSATQDFTEFTSINLSTESSAVAGQEISGTAYVAIADLESFCESTFGLSPKTETVYYRVPLSMVIDGTDYRLGSYTTYYAEGSMNFTYAPGANIESDYYLIGTVTNWADNGKEALNPYKFFNRYEDVYEHPIFTLYLDVEADSYWKIIPQSTYDAFDNVWNGVIYGPTTDGNTDLSGQLTSTNAGAGCIVNAGRYVFTINMLELTYTITPITDWMYYGIYFRGGENGWTYPAVDGFFSTNTSGMLLDPSVYLPAGTEFKIADANWGPINLGAGSDGKEVTPNSPLSLGASGGNLNISNNFVGYAELENSNDTWTLTLVPYASATAGTSTEIYVRGDMNSWGAEDSWEFKTTQYEGVYELSDVTIAANTGFKIADAGWSSINLGQGSEPMALDVAFPLYNGDSGNITLSEDFNGTIALIYNSKYDQYFLYFLTEAALVTPN